MFNDRCIFLLYRPDAFPYGRLFTDLTSYIPRCSESIIT